MYLLLTDTHEQIALLTAVLTGAPFELPYKFCIYTYASGDSRKQTWILSRVTIYSFLLF